MFNPVDPKPDFPALERKLLRQWGIEGTVEQYLKRNEASERRWSFVDGPITANNPMAVHHAWGRTYKDLFQRYKTMQGFRQRYQNGFDCQGLWIEVEVERELGFTSKLDIEAYGIGKFVDACKARVQKFAAQITQQSMRLGQWQDWDNSYFTNSDENNYAIWHFLKRCHEQGWLYKGNDSMPWCPRCATGISNMEIVTEGYQELTHPSVYLKLPLNEREGSLLVWTTTPWTLAANVAAAVHPDLTYARVRQGNDVLYVSKATLGVLKGDYTVEAELPGRELVGLTYRGPFDELPAQDGVVHRVIEWDEVTEDEGTGIVHIAPGCGQEDFALSKQFDLPVIMPIDQFGVYTEGFGFLTGQFAGDVAPAVFDSLRDKDVLYKVQDYAHRYPVCWRCGSELVFRVVDEWFINMDGVDKSTGRSLREKMMAISEKIRWIPEFGLARELDWLKNMSDWMISKKRYYGLALPIYPCECGHVDVIGGKEELRERAVEGWDAFNGHSPHRPWVDEVKIACSSCGKSVERIKDVGNPWLDAGIVPYSTLKYDTDRSYWEQWFPAEFITESFPGQFRNWFYAMLAMSAVLENREPFLTVLGHGQVRDEHGEEMHKSKGNAIWFDEAADKMGVDPMRWLFMRQNPAHNVNFGWTAGDEVRRSLILTLWNTYAFFVSYANIDGWKPTRRSPPRVGEGPGEGSAKNELDRWLLSELNQLVADVTASLDDYDTLNPTRRIESFVEDLSNWYVRRSRRRFWKSEDDADKQSAYETLYETLVTLSKLIAPFMPFGAEELYQNLVRANDAAAPTSVHLCDWPQADASLIDLRLSSSVKIVQELASLGRSARAKAHIKVRQPLQRVVVALPTPSATLSVDLHQLAGQLEAELNVKDVWFLSRGLGPDGAGYVAGQITTAGMPLMDIDIFDYQVRLNLPVLGHKYSSDMAGLQQAFKTADKDSVARRRLVGLPLSIDGFALQPEELLVTTTGKPGYAVAEDAGYAVAVMTEITDELRNEGLAREIVHRIQNLRRDAGFDISDRITTYWQSGADVGRVLQAHERYVKDETLSLQLVESAPPSTAHTEKQSVDGHDVTLGVEKA